MATEAVMSVQVGKTHAVVNTIRDGEKKTIRTVYMYFWKLSTEMNI